MEEIIINSVQEAWKKTEKELGFTGYFATPVSRYGYKLNSQDIENMGLTLFKVTSVFTVLGGTGFYLFSKSYPLFSELLTIIIFYGAAIFIAIKMKALVKNKETIKLPSGLITVYFKHLTNQLNGSTIAKWFLLSISCVIGLTFGFFAVVNKGFILFAYLLLLPMILLLFVSAIFQLYLTWLKLKNTYKAIMDGT